MPKAQLLSLIRIDSKKSHEIRKKIHSNWIKKRGCDCCNDDLIQSGKCVLTCKHIETEWKNKTEEIEERINKKIGVILIRNLREAYCLSEIS